LRTEIIEAFLEAMDWEVLVKHIYKEANQYADALISELWGNFE
jgi:hypothetical protein